MSGIVRMRVIAEGRVQGVFFRDSTRREAERRGVNGWVRNLADGRVEAVFEGPSEAVQELVEWARHGPERALVTRLETIAEDPEGISGFTIRH